MDTVRSIRSDAVCTTVNRCGQEMDAVLSMGNRRLLAMDTRVVHG
jgi:hypothetical protein